MSDVNEFIEQFVLESRELIEQTTATLLLLEQTPSDKDKIDEIFRAFHTLKGSAGIVDFAAMERAVHALETNLSEARSSSQTITNALISDCLACLDQVTCWLDVMQSTGEVPADADAQATAMLSRFASTNTAHADQSTTTHTISNQRDYASWVVTALAQQPALKQRVSTAVRFMPASDSFFSGLDPLTLMSALPGLLTVDMSPIDQWPALEAFDPFECISIFTALSEANVADVRSYLGAHAERCEVETVRADDVTTSTPLPAAAQALLKSQLELIKTTSTENFTGRVASAGIVARNVLLRCGNQATAMLVAQASEQSLQARNTQPLFDEIEKVLAVTTPALTVDQATAVQTNATQASHNTESVPRTLRIETERVDSLVRLTGELTVIKNAIGHGVRNTAADVDAQLTLLKEHHAVLDRLIGELQKSVLGMRVLPLRSVLQRFPRVVRDLANSLNKPTQIVIEGESTEADKAIVEMLFEPLLHIVRNAMDHGIESPATRARNNKAATATIRMQAFRQGEHVIVKISDDGGGIDVTRIRQVAIERNVISNETLQQLTDEEIINLVFAPGFSTASQVTELSGRGVGMDAVRTAVERIGGRVVIATQLGLGTTVTFTLPFSVMMTDVMSVEAGGQMYGIPLDAIVETLRVPLNSINAVGVAKVLVHRNRTIPVFDLSTILQTTHAAQQQTEVVIVITNFAGQTGGIQVDRLDERLSVMLKPLDGLLAGLPGIAGTTIVGDGRVLLVLDLAGVLQ